MNRKKFKRHKKSSIGTENDKNSNHEVLVLPPNLLEKLGINLGKMCVPQNSGAESSTDIQNNAFDAFVKRDILELESNSPTIKHPKEGDEQSSIIETANLIKKAVFLSPTFNTSQTMVLPNNLELTDLKKSDKHFTNDFDHSVEPNKNENVIFKLCSAQAQRDISKIQETIFQKEHTEINNKIILSEEFNKLKPLDSQGRKALVPVPIDSFISIYKSTTNSDRETINNNSSCANDILKKGECNNESINTEIESDISCLKNTHLNMSVPQEKISGRILEKEKTIITDKETTNSNPLEKYNITEKEAINRNVYDPKNIESFNVEILQEIHQNMTQENNIEMNPSVNNKDSTSIVKNQIDSVKTIADILSQHLNKKKQDDCNNFEKSQSQKNFFTLKQNKIKSKLSVQGVEKPGGEDQLDNFKTANIKTYYVRNKKSSLLENSSKPAYEYNLEVAATLDIDYKIKVDHSNIQYPQQFCICSDFGQLDQYTVDENHKHVHFWNTESISSLDIVFSIYDDNTNNTINYNECNDFEETLDNNICYNIHLNDESDTVNTRFCKNKNIDKLDKEQDNKQKLNVNEKSKSICDDAMSIYELAENDSKLISLSDDHNNKIEDTTEIQTVYNIIEQNDSVLDTNFDDFQNENKEDANTKKKRTVSLNRDTEVTIGGPCCKKPTETIKCHICENSFAETELEKHISHVHNINDKNIDESKTETAWEVPLVEQRKVEGASQVVCGVCAASLPHDQWAGHRARDHSYLAWQEGETPIDLANNNAVHDHLVHISNEIGELTCNNCFVSKKNVKSYLRHIKDCGVVSNEISENVQCGVCQQEIRREEWADHRETEHNYIAWKTGEPKLAVDDQEILYNHLYDISKEIGGLKCAKCGRRRKYVKSYLQHVQACDGSSNTTLEHSINNTMNESALKGGEVRDSSDDGGGGAEGGDVTCGVCGSRVLRREWREHARKQHAYLAWREGQTPLDVLNEDAVYNHLRKVLKKSGELICRICGERRKYIKSYLHHVEMCDKPTMSNGPTQEETVKCGVCEKEMNESEWLQHIAKEHNYLAWKNGHPELDSADKNAVHEHLFNICSEVGELTCSTCSIQKKNVNSYLRHIKDCASTGNEISENVQCGVCQQELRREEWADHRETEHNYIAWKTGEPKLDLQDEEKLHNHLYHISKDIGGLKCSKCGRRRKYVKSYLHHLQTCDGSLNTTLEHSINNTMNESTLEGGEVGDSSDDGGGEAEGGEVTCGVCGVRVLRREWREHARKQHAYLAWREGQTPLDISNEKLVYNHLRKILKKAGELICGVCNERRRYAKSYLQHVGKCDGSNVTLKKKSDDTLNESAVSAVNSTLQEQEGEYNSDDGEDGEVTCGVCSARVLRREWHEHAWRQHAYLAWREGETPLNVNDKEAVYEHLYNINRKYNGLTCSKCDITRKYVKVYLAHVESCDSVTVRTPLDLDVYECAICSIKVEPSEWKSHAMKKHYNIAWIVGESPIDVKNPFMVEKYLKEYKQKYNKLECSVCGLTRVSFAGFYAHIIQCGKTDEETEMYKNMCEICNNKYLCIYKHQHMSMHREQENAKHRKLLQAEKQNEQKEPEESTGRRRAAEKAKNVIEKYKSDGAHKCPTCGFDADDESDLAEHNCAHARDSDAASHFDSSSSSDSFDSDVESDHSNNERLAEKKKKKKHGDTMAAKVIRIPFKVNKPKAYLAESAEDFCNMYFTSDVLFPKWRMCEYEVVSDDRIGQYMPQVKQSCKVMFESKEWTTYQQFEARVSSGVGVFVGGSIQCVSWAPPHVNDQDDSSGNFLMVASHREADTPRFDVSQTYRHSNMLQLWDFGTFNDLPKLVMGIAHDCGTVWSMEWCPSGARDVLVDGTAVQRLGLLAAACSDGSAYIFSVPYPSTIVNGDKLLYKLKPVAVLRFSRGEREVYQATSISWSLEKGHSVVVVGYADGMIGFYNLELESPLLTAVEDGTTVFYPYEEEQRHNSSITDLSTLPSAWGGAACVCSASQTGAALRLRGAAVRSLLPATRAALLPHWPSAIMAGNDTIVTQAVNELDCWGVGRRLGSVQWWCGCWRSGRAAVCAPPAIRLVNAHPAYKDMTRKDVAIIQMRPLEKVKKLKNDGLAVKLEPTKFEDAVKSYGLEFKLLGNAKDIHQVSNKEQCPERFPLADVTSMAFCPSATHHRKLAVATHSGLIFLITV